MRLASVRMIRYIERLRLAVNVLAPVSQDSSYALGNPTGVAM